MKGQIGRLLSFAISFGLTYASSVSADDLDIYVSDASQNETSINNILLLVDSSGSLTSTVRDGSGESRKTQLDRALKTIIGGLPDDTRVGIARYNHPGGSILYPISKLSDTADSIKSATIQESGNDAYEVVGNGEVFAATDKLKMYTGVRSNARKIAESEGDVEICGNGTDFLVNGGLHAGYDGSGCGAQHASGQHEYNFLKFNDLWIPQGADLTSANIYFSFLENSSADAEIEFFVQKSVSPTGLSLIENESDVNGFSRQWVENEFGAIDYIKWQPVDAGYIGEWVSSPNLARLVQEVVSDPSWVPGESDIVIGFRDVIDAPAARTAFYSYDQDPLKAPVISVSYKYSAGYHAPNSVGLRFPDFEVPSGAVISEAYLILTNADSTIDSPATRSITVGVERSMDTDEYSENDYDISSREYLVNSGTQYFYDAIQSDDRIVIDIKDVLSDRLSPDNWDGDGDLTFKISSGDIAEIYSSESGDYKSPKIYLKYNSVIPEGLIPGVISKRVTGSEGDGVEFERCNNLCRYRNGGNNVNLTEDSIRISDEIWGGFTFNDVQLPRKVGDNVLIEEAYIEFTSNDDYAGSATATLLGYGRGDMSEFKDSRDYLTRGDGVNDEVFSGVNFTVSDWVEGGKYRTEDISALIEEMISESYWNAGSSLSFRMIGVSDQQHEFYTFDGSASGAPKLYIKYKARNIDGTLTVRQKLVDLVDEIPAQGYTPFEGSLYEVHQYFSGSDVEFGKSRNFGGTIETKRLSHYGTYVGGNHILPNRCNEYDLSDRNCRDERINGNPVYVSPMSSSSCETNNIIFLTDGEPSGSRPNDFSISDGKRFDRAIADLTGKSCSGHEECSKDIVEYMATKDLIPSLSGIQNVNTHMIAFDFSDADAVEFMEDLAMLGNGTFKVAQNADELIGIVQTIVDSIFDVTTTIVTPGVAVNNNNRFQHLNELYYSVFKPSGRTFWVGNVKKYIFEKEDSANPDSDFVIKDKNGNVAVTQDGIFSQDSQSFWSSVVDGAEAKVGGAASQIRDNRPLYTYLGGDSNPKNIVLGVDHELDKDNVNLTNEILGITGRSAEDIADIRDYASGLDVFDSDGDDSRIDGRRLLGAGLHSRPLVVAYGDKNIVYSTSNEGFLHAFDSEDGEEYYSFMPPEFLSKIKNDFESSPGRLQYGWDSSVIALRRDADGDGSIVSGGEDFVYVYGGFRRGGSKYYALDVTGVRDAGGPKTKLLFTIGTEADSAFSNMGQSWSVPVISKMKINGEIRRVLVFGGGYDTAYDQEELIMSAGNYKGSSIYVVDAITGELVWQVSNPLVPADNTQAQMTHSFVSSPVILDINGDGITDVIYASDISGQIWRIDVSDEANNFLNALDVKMIAKLGASGSDPDIRENFRRFYEAPAISFMSRNGVKYVAIFAGSGFRASPLDRDTTEEIYLIRDYEVLNDGAEYSITSPYKKISLADITNITNKDDADAQVEGKNGWYLTLGATGESKGEKMIGEPIVFNGEIIATLYQPEVNGSDCAPVPGTSTVMKLGLWNGTPNDVDTKDFDPEDRYSGETTVGLTSGAKILYTNGGSEVVSVINTNIESLGAVGSLGLKRKSWRRLRGILLDEAVNKSDNIKEGN